MHTNNINLHNLKTTLIFCIEISRDYTSRHGLRIHVPNYIIFRRSAAEIRGGGCGIHPPPPPAVRWSQKTRIF